MMGFMFTLLSVVLVGSALGVVLFRNPIHSALCLVLNLLTVAGFYALLDAHFLAMAQVIVYSGAIVVLVLFVLMLLNLKKEKFGIVGALLGAIGLLGAIVFLWLVQPLIVNPFSGFNLTAIQLEGTVEAVGKLLYTEYLLPFEVTSVLIIVGIVGAVMIARKEQN